MESTLRERPVGTTERRLANRVEAMWRSIADGRTPRWADIENLDLGPDAAFCFAVDMRLSDGFPYFVFLGDALCRFSTLYLSGRANFEDTLLDIVAGKLHEALEAAAPLHYDDSFALYDGREIIFRSVFLPLSDNGRDITHIFGAANGKFLSP